MNEQELGQIIPDIEATGSVENTTGIPSVNITVEEINELNRLVRKFNFAFKNMKGAKGDKGDKPVKGVDYYTSAEKEQFTTETKEIVSNEGNRQLEAISKKGNDQALAITNKGAEQVNIVASEGNKQTTLISGEVNKAIQQLKELVSGNPDTSNAQALSGKSRIEFERDTQALAGKYAGNFPLTSAVKDGVYLVPATGKFYVCTQAYNGSNLTAPNANFEEMSVWANRDKLSNLHGYELVASGSATEETINVEQEIFDFDQYNKKTPQFHFISSLVLEIICITGTQHTSYGGQGSTQIIKYLILPANTVSPCKIGEISPIGVQLFNIKNNKIFYTAKHKENKYAVYINKLPIQFIY